MCTSLLICSEDRGPCIATCVIRYPSQDNSKAVPIFHCAVVSVHSHGIRNTSNVDLAIGSLGGTRLHAPSFIWHNESLYCFSTWEKASLHFQCILKGILHKKDFKRIAYKSAYILYYLSVLSSYVCDYVASLANADFIAALKCLSSGKKPIEQLCPSVPRQYSCYYSATFGPPSLLPRPSKLLVFDCLRYAQKKYLHTW